jgi:hypothetical protein
VTPARPDHQGTLLTHTVLVALTPLIPVPFLDDMVKGYWERRMIRQLAEGHHLRIWDEEVRALAEGPRKNVVAGFAKGIVLAPLKKLLRKTFILLSGKKMVDLASQTYHLGWLIDHAFANAWCAPHGPCAAAEIRTAIERVMAGVPLASSPVTNAIKVGLSRSQEVSNEVFDMVRARMGVLRRDPRDDEVAKMADDVADEGVVARVADNLRRALTEVPSEHFDELGERLRRELAIDQHELAMQTELESNDG